jgi:predicted amidophosphoribosyltransferase
MNCPSCSAEVEEGADLCLECGEPMGDSPAARVARSEPSSPPAPVAPRPQPPSTPPPRTAPARKWARVDEPEPRRCPGCGTKSLAERCPGCGTRLRASDDE